MSPDGPEGATPLDDDELADLIPRHLTRRAQLDAWEQLNIAGAMAWLDGRRERPEVLEIGFLLELHRRMFNATWRWAGAFRVTEKNLGVAPEAIREALQNLLDDTHYWIAHESFQLDEIGVRFHHRLVVIHPFVNGNGRHARLATDLLVTGLGASPFTWGSGSLGTSGTARARYLSALREADNGSMRALLEFVRS